MKLNEFDYNLPLELIADRPSKPRDHSRLLVLGRKSGRIEYKKFYDIVSYFHTDDILVINNSKVFPARLIGQKEMTQGKVEILLEHETEPGWWRVVGRGLDVGKRVSFSNSNLKAIVKAKKDGLYEVLFNLSGESFIKEIDRIGLVPLPPYIVKKRKEAGGSLQNQEDRDSYQTVYAEPRGSVAAPTAGLHFTPKLLDRIRQKGVKILTVTLHVGLGTFTPVKTQSLLEHKMHAEHFSIAKSTIDKIAQAKNNGKRVIAVGTTTTRVLEHIFSSYDTKKISADISGQTDIFIYPGYEFQCIDGLITNFHLPKSTLLMLVSAFAGHEKIITAYQEAIKSKYHFYSYGDAMLIL